MNTVRATQEHVDDAIRWMVARGTPAPHRDIFSSTGWCVPGVAAWWLYLTDSTLAWTEMLVGNPDVAKTVRRAGLDAVIARLLSEAKANGVRLLVCNVDRPDLEERALKHGYRVLGRNQTMLGINLILNEGT
jgi:hypothetical protein